MSALAITAFASSKKGRSKIANFFGAKDRRLARIEAAKADSARLRSEGMDDKAYQEQRLLSQALRNEVSTMQDKRTNIYDPMEAELAQRAGERDLEGAADAARGEFTTQFDAAQDMAQRQAMQYGQQPGSQQAIRMNRLSTYDRARGAADVANTARTEEDDKSFMRQAAFYNQNGRGMEERLMRGLSSAYGTDIDAYRGNAAALRGESQYHQGNSDRHAAASKAGMNLVGNIAGMGLSAITGGMGGGMGGNGAARGAINNAPQGTSPAATRSAILLPKHTQQQAESNYNYT